MLMLVLLPFFELVCGGGGGGVDSCDGNCDAKNLCKFAM